MIGSQLGRDVVIKVLPEELTNDPERLARPDGAFRPLAWFDSRHVERLFRAEVLRILLSRNLITEQVVTNLLSWRHSGFSAHGAVCVPDREGAVRLGRYMIRCPIVLERPAQEPESLACAPPETLELIAESA